MKKRHASFLSTALVLLVSASACATRPVPPTDVAAVPEFRPGYIAGYLDEDSIPDSLVLLGPPPARGSDAESLDYSTASLMQTSRDTQRWLWARKDASLKMANVLDTFSCALGFRPSEKDTPHLAMLIRRSMIDAGRASSGAKEKYGRDRPFEMLGQASCTPEDEERLKNDGSYPSGHAAMGTAWALMLAGLLPKQRDALMQRGLAFGESRVVCGVHWTSDVEAGKKVGTATYTALRKNPLFIDQLKLARLEVLSQKKSPSGLPVDCELQSGALLEK